MSIKSMPVWKWVLLLIASFVLALLMYAGAQMAGDISAIDWVNWIIAIAVSAAMIALYAVFVKWFEKHPARDIPRSKLVGDTAKGLAVGAGFMAAVVLVMMAFGLYRITGAGTDRPLAIISAFFLFIGTALFAFYTARPELITDPQLAADIAAGKRSSSGACSSVGSTKNGALSPP